jgi:alpha-tubulin suppressor-like RCC1 family protein
MPKLFSDVIVAAKPAPAPAPLPKESPREVRDERRFVTEAGLHGSTRMACGWRHCVAVNAVGEVCAWGSNSHGQVRCCAVVRFAACARG